MVPTFIPILPKSTPRPRSVKSPASGHTAVKWPLRQVPPHTAYQSPAWLVLCPPSQHPPVLISIIWNPWPCCLLTHTSPPCPRAFAYAVCPLCLECPSRGWLLTHSSGLSGNVTSSERPSLTTPEPNPDLSLRLPHPVHSVMPSCGLECRGEQESRAPPHGLCREHAPPPSRHPVPLVIVEHLSCH